MAANHYTAGLTGEDDSSFQGPLNNGIEELLDPLNPKVGLVGFRLRHQ